MGRNRKEQTKSSQMSMSRIRNNFLRINKNKYDVEFIDFALKNLATSYHVSVQYLMCVFIVTGLENHPTYSENMEELRREFEEWKKAEEAQLVTK